MLSLFVKKRSTPLANTFVLEASAGPEPAPFTLLSRMNDQRHKAAAGHDDVEKTFDLVDAAAENCDHMVAGIDTTGDALCFLMWELSQPRSLVFQERLRRELRDNAQSDSPVPTDRLPFLDVVIQEGLRCFPAIPMSLPRVVPGRHWGGRTTKATRSLPSGPDGRVIDGFFLPAGTIVSSQPYSVHRLDTAVFPDPDTFNPDRWLAQDGDADRKRLFFAFASGGRGCVGKQYVSFLPPASLLPPAPLHPAPAPPVPPSPSSATYPLTDPQPGHGRDEDAPAGHLQPLCHHARRLHDGRVHAHVRPDHLVPAARPAVSAQVHSARRRRLGCIRMRLSVEMEDA